MKFSVRCLLIAIPNKALETWETYDSPTRVRIGDLHQTSFSNGAAYGDLDNDGDLDLVVNNVNQKAFVYQNKARETGKNNFIGFVLKGRDGNRFAIGSKIKIYQGNEIISRELITTRGFQSSIDYKVIAGLGNKNADSVIITWPDRSITKIDNPAINTVHTIQQNASVSNVATGMHTSAKDPVLELVKQDFDKHKENEFIDFFAERNIPVMLSREGPKAARGDVNGDGTVDVFIGGASDQGGQLYLQTGTGFIKKRTEIFDAYAQFEDVATLLFDCDGDGDIDLFIGAGGNNHPPNSKQMQHRLFKNDGKGNFQIDSTAFPSNSMNISVAAANDFDHDGDIDLFVGSRSIPYNYGVSPSSYLYVNDGKGHFQDVAKQQQSELSEVGLVTGAIWQDIIGGKEKELIVVGEWMSPRVFSFSGNKIEEIKTNLGELNGWWQSVASSDLDGDGDQDLVLGNIGENFYLRPNDSTPVKIWINDFDLNGSLEKIITRTVNGKDVPVFLKRDLTDQVASLKKQNLRYSEFAKKSIADLFSPEIIKNCTVKNFDYTSSVIAYNDGNGKFTIQKLPASAQFSTVNAILCTDINEDRKPDIILGGNQFGFQPQFGRLDASRGHLLVNTGDKQFKDLAFDQSGLRLQGEIKDIVEIQGKNQRYILILQNNEKPVLYKINSARN